MTVRLGLCLSCAAMLLVGCGAGDPTGATAEGVLHVTSGGTGDILFTRTLDRLSFANSVTVAIREGAATDNRFTIYTLFGLQAVDFSTAPTAALVTFVDGLEPNRSSSTTIPSSVVTLALHTGFTATSQIAAQDAPVVFEQASNGTFVLEPTPATDGVFVSQDSASRRMRFSVVTMTDLDSGDEALLQGGVDYQISANISQRFLGYAGNLGLNRKPAVSGGGPPPPPGSTGLGSGPTLGGGGGTTSGDDGGPPAPASF